MKLPLDALKDPRGIGYLAGAAVTFAIGGALLVATVRRYLDDWTVADAVRAFHQDDPAAAQAFATMRTDRPTDPVPRVFLGAWEADRSDLDSGRLEVAERLFDEAAQLEPGARPAAVGRLVVALRKAAGRTAAQRPAAATQAEELLRDLDPSHPDVLPLRAALEVLRKRPDEARKLLEAPPAQVPSHQPYGAWMWNRAVARMLCKDGRALDDAFVAFQLRRWPDPAPVERVAGEPPAAPDPRADAGSLLTMAYRVGLADPAAQNAKDFAARCARAQRALDQGPGSRNVPPTKDDLGAAWNALGLGYMKLAKGAEAVTAFTAARQAVPDEPAYYFNLAAANRLLAESIPADKETDRQQALTAAGQAYADIVDYLSQDEARMKGRDETFLLALQNACATFIDAGQGDSARRCYFAYHDRVPNEAQRNRDLGAVFDWGGDGAAALEYYKKAIDLGHKDAGAMKARIRVLESNQ